MAEIYESNSSFVFKVLRSIRKMQLQIGHYYTSRMLQKTKNRLTYITLWKNQFLFFFFFFNGDLKKDIQKFAHLMFEESRNANISREPIINGSYTGIILHVPLHKQD